MGISSEEREPAYGVEWAPCAFHNFSCYQFQTQCIQTPAWVRDLLSLNTDPTCSTLVLVPHDGGRISFPALPLLAASSTLAQLVTEDMMADPSSPVVIHLPASWDALIIVKELVLTGFTASDGVIYTATSENVFNLISMLDIEGNITKKVYEVPSEDDPEIDEGLGGEGGLSQPAVQNSFERRAAVQPCLAPPLQGTRRSMRLAAGAATIPDERIEKELSRSCAIDEPDNSHGKTQKRKSTCKKSNMRKSGTAIKVISCKECFKQFKHKSGLYYHEQAHHKGIRFHCDLCPAQFSASGNLATHKKSVHQGIKYPCNLCPYQATQRTSLAIHKKSVHEGIKYPCDLCPSEFTLRSSLAIHKKSVHEGIKYLCDLCSKEFTLKGKLAAHKKFVHKK